MVQPQEPPVRIFSKAGPSLSVSVRNNQVVLATTNPHDQAQQWYKVDVSKEVKDTCGCKDDGHSRFNLINRATKQAIKHPAPNKPVLLASKYSDTDLNVVWSERQLSNGYKKIVVATDVSLFWDVYDHVAKDGVNVGIDYYREIDVQSWIITPWAPLPYIGNPVRISNKAKPDLYLSIKDGEVALSKYDANSKLQQWFKREIISKCNDEGYSCFALINESTFQAIKYSNALPAELTWYYSDNDQSIQWTERNLTDGFKSLRTNKDNLVAMDALAHRFEDGTPVGKFKWHGEDNQRWLISRCVTLPPTTFPVKVRFFCKNYPQLSIALKEDKVILANHNANDESQAWYRHEVRVTPTGNKAEDLIPRFVVVNKSTGLAIRHAFEKNHPMRLLAYNPADVDKSLLWTELQLGDGNFRAIKKFNDDGDLTWDAQSIPVYAGCTLGLATWHGKDNQRWVMEPLL